MSDDSSEKQHQASGKRLDDMRKKGQSLRSKDLSGGLIFMVGIVMVIIMSWQIAHQLMSNFRTSFGSIQSIMHGEDFLTGIFSKMITDTFYILLPVLLMTLVTALLSPFLFGGWNFTLEALHFKLEKLNPITNLANIFSKKIFINVGKSILKVSLLIGVFAFYVFSNKAIIIDLINFPVKTSIHATYSIVKDYIILISASLIFIILYDVISSFFEFQTKSKMSSQELKDEYKETEGSVEVKRKIRSAQIAILKQSLALAVPKATVIITNPTHYAVAIKYDEHKDAVPKVVAKGKGFVAQQIRQLAITNRVPIYEAPLLARAIFNTSKINTEVNPGLYMAIAIVLSYINQLNKYQHGLAKAPQRVHDLKIPDALIFNE
jgi:flagellar biosynthetic protein FlhB